MPARLMTSDIGQLKPTQARKTKADNDDEHRNEVNEIIIIMAKNVKHEEPKDAANHRSDGQDTWGDETKVINCHPPSFPAYLRVEWGQYNV